MILHLYALPGGRVLIPTVANTDAGYQLEIDPVESVPVEAGALAMAISRVVSRGTPVVAAPTRKTFPKPVVLAPAGVRSWAEFERRARALRVEMTPQRTTIIIARRSVDGGLVDGDRENLSNPESVEELCERLVRLLAH